MSDIDLLRKMIVDSAIVLHSNSGKNKCSVMLSEEDEQNKIPYAFKISGLPQDSITFRADKFPEAVHFYQGSRGENKRADYVIVADTGKKKWILFIEVKSGKHSENRDMAKQLKGAECVVAHCRAVAEKFWDENSLLDSNVYENRFIGIVKVNIPKRPTRNRPSGIVHDKAENMLIVRNPGSSLRFDKLTSSGE